MPPVSGIVKTNKLRLQGRGAYDGNDVQMEVEDSTFFMTMGSNILLSVAPEGAGEFNNASVDGNSVLTIMKDTVFEGTLDVKGEATFDSNLNVGGDASFDSNLNVGGMLQVNDEATFDSNLSVNESLAVNKEISIGTNGSKTVLNPQISDELKTTLKNICDNGAWQSSYGQSTDFIPYGNNIYSPVASVHVWKNGDTWEYSAGKLNGSEDSPSVDKDTIYQVFSLTKTVTALLYARFISLGIIPPGHSVKVSDVFPILKDITYAIPSFSSTSNASTVAVDPYNPSNYVNLTPVTRPLYLEDVLSESVGFASTDGYDYNFDIHALHEFHANPALNETFPVLGAVSKMVAYDAAATAIYGSNHAGIYNSVLANPTVDPITNFTSYIAGFSNGALAGKPCLMYQQHGVFQYNSSANIGTATLLQFYRNFYPEASNMSYFDVLKKELLDPVGADLFYYFDSPTDPRLAKVAAIWKAGADNLGYQIDPLVDSSQDNGRFGNLIYQYTYGSDSSYYPKNYNGNYGLYGTMEAYSKVARLLALNGLTDSGVRLIDTNAIALLRIPRVTVDELSTASTLKYLYKSFTGTFSLGGLSRGPSYANAITSDPTFQLVTADLPGSVTANGMGVLSSSKLGSIAFDTAPKDEFGWAGTGGSWCITCADTKTVLVLHTLEQNQLMGVYKVISPVFTTIQNDYFHPTSLTTIKL